MSRSIGTVQTRMLMMFAMLTLPMFSQIVSIQDAHADSVFHTSPDCYTTLIHLNGTAPATTTCLQPGKLVSGKVVSNVVVHDTSTVTCDANYITLKIISLTDGNVCFTGQGYLGIFLDQVRYVDYLDFGGWIRFYSDPSPQPQSSGFFYYYSKGESTVDQYPADASHYLTQVNIY
jgi:hypothetical protein